MDVTGEMRTFLANLAKGVVHGDVKVPEALAATKACKEINTSLYSEIKSALLQKELGQDIPKLGALPIGHEKKKQK